MIMCGNLGSIFDFTITLLQKCISSSQINVNFNQNVSPIIFNVSLKLVIKCCTCTLGTQNECFSYKPPESENKLTL
jgi:hypothetical protein